MGSRNRRLARERRARRELKAGAGSRRPVGNEAGLPERSLNESQPAGYGESPTRASSGLTTIQDAKLVRRSFNWRREQRFPTRTPVKEIIERAAAENRALTPVDQSVITAVALQDGIVGIDPLNCRDAVRGLQCMAMGVRLILEMERFNADDDHAKANRGIPAGQTSAVVGVNVTTSPAGDTQTAIAILEPAERNRRLEAIADRLRNRR